MKKAFNGWHLNIIQNDFLFGQPLDELHLGGFSRIPGLWFNRKFMPGESANLLRLMGGHCERVVLTVTFLNFNNFICIQVIQGV